MMHNAPFIAEKIIANARKSINSDFNAWAIPVVQRAKQRLEKTFEISLTLPSFDPDEYSWEGSSKFNPRYIEKQRQIVEYRVERRRTWRTLWLWKTEVKIELPPKTQTYYVISIKDLVTSAQKKIDTDSELIVKNVIEFIDGDLAASIDQMLANLNHIIEAYKWNPNQSLNSQQQTLEQQNHLKNVLEQLGKKAKLSAERTKEIRQNVKPLMAQ